MPKGIFKRTEETKEKIRNGHLGKKHSEETKLKMSLIKKGKKPYEFTDEIRKKMSLSRLGKVSGNKGNKYSLETKRKISESKKGCKSHFWKGGVTPLNIILRTSLEYRLWREAVFKRDNYTCIWCNQKGVKLNADHIKQFAFYPELRFAIDNGRTLCVDCHKTTDTFKKNKKI